MAEIIIRNWKDDEVGKLQLNSDIFGVSIREDILHRVVQWQLSKARLGCHKVKQRNEVNGSTRKIYRQKGTGQARHGSIKAPIFVGGGTVFGPVVRSHEYSLNKKVRKMGLKIALSAKASTNCILVIDSLKLESHKTCDFKKAINAFNNKSILIVDSIIDKNLNHASANIVGIDTLPVNGLNVYDILKHELLIISESALSDIEKRLAC